MHQNNTNSKKIQALHHVYSWPVQCFYVNKANFPKEYEGALYLNMYAVLGFVLFGL